MRYATPTISAVWSPQVMLYFPMTLRGNERSDAGPREAGAVLHVRKLLELTTCLSEPLTTEEVARVVVDQAAAAVGALTVIMWTVDDPPTHATLVRAIGCNQSLQSRYGRIPLEPWLPMADAMLRHEALFFESRANFRERYPVAERGGPELEVFRELSYACLPFVVHGRSIGGASLVFPGTRAFDDDERVFLTVLAHHAAQALERASLFDREKASRERLQCLQELTAALSFLDIGLPVMDGYELAQQLRGLPGLADTPLVAVTGYAQDEPNRAANDGAPDPLIRRQR